MKNKKKIWIGFVSILSVITISACSSNDDNASDENMENHNNTEEHEDMDMSSHSSSGEIPADLKAAENPTYEVGSKAIIKDAHMDGMEGAEATIAGAYDTTVYTVTYTPTTGGEKVEDHKWVIHQELKDAGDKKFEPGTEVVLDTDHMEGMKGAKAVIDSAEDTTVYMIDFTPTTGGEEVKNHKWVTESELSTK